MPPLRLGCRGHHTRSLGEKPSCFPQVRLMVYLKGEEASLSQPSLVSSSLTFELFFLVTPDPHSIGCCSPLSPWLVVTPTPGELVEKQKQRSQKAGVNLGLALERQAGDVRGLFGKGGAQGLTMQPWSSLCRPGWL